MSDTDNANELINKIMATEPPKKGKNDTDDTITRIFESRAKFTRPSNGELTENIVAIFSINEKQDAKM